MSAVKLDRSGRNLAAGWRRTGKNRKIDPVKICGIALTNYGSFEMGLKTIGPIY